MLYKLMGFSQNGPIRRFSFQRVGQSATPETFAVSADIVAARDFGISLQELPSLCSNLLQKSGEDQPAAILHLTVADMTLRAAEHAADRDAKKKGKFRPNAGPGGVSPDDSLPAPAPDEGSSAFSLESSDVPPVEE